MIIGDKSGQNDRPDPNAPGKKLRSDSIGRPNRNKMRGQKHKSHPMKQIGSLSDERGDRAQQNMKERHVIVEDVAILHQSLSPTPNYMEVLRFVGIEPVMKEIQNIQCDQNRQQAEDSDKL